MKKIILATAAGAVFLAGCADMNMSDTQRRTATGAGIGAVAGAVLGSTGGNAGAGAAVGAGVGALGGYIWSQRMERQKQEMEAATRGTGVAVSQTADNQLRLDIPADISFDVGRANVKSNFAPVLDQFANGLRNNPNALVRIIGHTDSTGSDAINNPLSVDRAQSVRDYLAGRGILPTRIETSGRGSHEPIADNTSEAGRAKNRRVEILLREPEQAGAPAAPKS